MEREMQQNGQEAALIVTGIDRRHGLLEQIDAMRYWERGTFSDSTRVSVLWCTYRRIRMSVANWQHWLSIGCARLIVGH